MQFPRLDAITTPALPKFVDRRRYLAIAVLAAVAVGLGVFAFVQHRQLVELREDSARTIEAHLKTIALRNQQVEALDALATRIDAFNREFGARLGRIEIDNLENSLDHVQHQGHLPEDAKRTLDEFEKSAKDIDAMTAKLKEFEQYLGAPVAVKRGQTHKELAKRYLIDQAKLSPEEAEKVVRTTALDFDVEPGNLVFNLYHDGIFLSTVTQGTAKRSPLMVQLARRRAMEKKNEQLTQQVGQLKTQLAKTVANGDPPAPAPGSFWLKRTDGTVTTTSESGDRSAPGNQNGSKKNQ